MCIIRLSSLSDIRTDAGLDMHQPTAKILAPIVIGLLIVSLVFIATGAEADASAGGFDVNGLFWGDGDYQDYHFYSESEPDGRSFLYVNRDSPNIINVLVRISWIANDNAFSPENPNQDPYLASVNWKNPHDLGRLIGSDHLAIFMECEGGDSVSRWSWTQDLLYDADEGPGYDWRSDSFGPDGAPVTSPTRNAIPSSGIIITSHSSLEYNLEHSSWISDQQNTHPNNPELWMSPDLAPLGTISMTTPVTDVNAMTGIHEDYPFYVRTGADPGDLYEWELSYEMLLDVSHCGGESVFIGVSSAHNSPPKDGTEDILIPTAIRLSELSASGNNGDQVPILVMTGILLIVSIVLFLRRPGSVKAS
jgi:hypothetical protein